jgi:hypothetical protein
MINSLINANIYSLDIHNYTKYICHILCRKKFQNDNSTGMKFFN